MRLQSQGHKIGWLPLKSQQQDSDLGEGNWTSKLASIVALSEIKPWKPLKVKLD